MMFSGHPSFQSCTERCVFSGLISSPKKIRTFVEGRNRDWIFNRQLARSTMQMLWICFLFIWSFLKCSCSKRILLCGLSWMTTPSFLDSVVRAVLSHSCSVLSRHLADRNAELERMNRINQSLQDDWERSTVMKKHRDLEEKAFER